MLGRKLSVPYTLIVKRWN